MRNLRRYITCVKIDNMPDHTSINSDLLASIRTQLAQHKNTGDFYYRLLINNEQVGISNSAAEGYIKDRCLEFVRLHMHKLSLGDNDVYYRSGRFSDLYQYYDIAIRYAIEPKRNIIVQITDRDCDFMIDYELAYNSYDSTGFPDKLTINKCSYKLSDCDEVYNTKRIYTINMHFNSPDLESPRDNMKRRRIIKTARTRTTIVGDKLILSAGLGRIVILTPDISKTTYVLDDDCQQTTYEIENLATKRQSNRCIIN